MPYFEAKNRTVYSPVDERLQPLYDILEKHRKTIGGSHVFDELAEAIEYADQVYIAEKAKIILQGGRK